MSAIAATQGDKDSAIAVLLKRIEQRRRDHTGATIPDVRKGIAREAGVAPGTLENIGRGRSKGLKGIIRDRLAEFAIREIQREMQRLEHDLRIAVAVSDRLDAAAVVAAQTALDDAKAFLKAASQ